MESLSEPGEKTPGKEGMTTVQKALLLFLRRQVWDLISFRSFSDELAQNDTLLIQFPDDMKLEGIFY